MDKKERATFWKTFLWDVFVCSLGAYGGPEAHFGIFIDQLVEKKRYLEEEEFVELMALTQVLPGPSSTQTIVAIGHKLGGPPLALLTMLVWALPALLLMAAFSFLGGFLEKNEINQDIFRFIGPMAIAFILMATYRLGKKVIVDKFSLGLYLFSAICTIFLRAPWVFPLILILGGGAAVIQSKEEDLWNRPKIRPPWIYLFLFFLFALGGLVLDQLLGNLWVDLFESFYRYGYLVIGGGQVVVPLMSSEMIDIKGYLTQEEFLQGFGLVQGLPGPMFSFSAYVGGLAARGSFFGQVLGASIAGLAIFLPGVLLIFFIYPIWEEVKAIKGIRISLKGVTAVASGLVLASGLHMLGASQIDLSFILVLALSLGLLLSKKVPAPVLVALVLALGYFIPS